MYGPYPLHNFGKLRSDEYDIERRVIHKSPFKYGKHKQTFEKQIYTKIADNFKVTSNRTLDICNTRGFDMIYETSKIV